MAATGSQRKSNQQSQELPDSEDYIKNRKECHKQINYFENAPNRPKWMRHFRYFLSDKVMHIGFTSGAHPSANKSTVIELNQGNSTFVAELKRAIIYFQKLCYNHEKQATATQSIDSCDGNCSWSRVDKKYPLKEKIVELKVNPWERFEIT